MDHDVDARPRLRTTVSGCLAVLTTALVLTGCGVGANQPDRPAATTSPTGSASPSAGGDLDAGSEATVSPSGDAGPTVEEIALSAALDHVHGLHVRRDGVLLAGTHTGVVAIDPDGGVTRVGAGKDDLMGMTGVPGTDTLVSSGHPGEGSDLPDPLGLIVSLDGGITWTARALTGQVDFHALASDGQTVAGFDGREGLLISTDAGATYQRGASIAPAALAITPAGIWATTAEGPQHSADGGLSFSVVADAPLLVLIASGADGSLWGIDTDGWAWSSTHGSSWEQRGHAGAVEALAVGPSGTAYAVTAEALIVLG